MTATLDIPIDEFLGDVVNRLAPESVVSACREQLRRVEPGDRDAWRQSRIIEALYHPGRYMRIAYAFTTDAEVPSHRLWPQAQIVYVRAPVRRPMSQRGSILSLNGAEVEVYRFPNDRRLRGLRKFASRESATATWQGWIDEAKQDASLDPASLQRTLMRYVPEQKWVVRLRACASHRSSGKVQQRRIGVRLASPTSCAALLKRHLALRRPSEQADAAFRVCKVVGHNIPAGLLAVKWTKGMTLLEALEERPSADVMAGIAAMLGAFHASAVQELRRLGPEDLRRSAESAADDLSLACPELGPAIGELVTKLDDRLRNLGSTEQVTLHNDLHWNQVRIESKRFKLLDLERLAVGDPLIDVANFAMQVLLLGDRPEHAVTADTARRWAGEFLQQWSKLSGARIDATRFSSYAAISLLELARGMMRHLRPGWRTLANRCVVLAGAELADTSREAVVL